MNELEAIKYCEEVAEQNCCECGKEHKQLALWLKELLTLREKNSPKKPYMESDGDADGYPVWDYYCPSCNEYFDEYEPKYCWKCGQAIDWSNNKKICPAEDCVNCEYTDCILHPGEEDD